MGIEFGPIHYKILQRLKDWYGDCPQQRLFVHILSNFPQLQAGKARVRAGNSASKNSLLLLIYCVCVSEPGLGQGCVPYRAATGAVVPWSHSEGLILSHFEAISRVQLVAGSHSGASSQGRVLTCAAQWPCSARLQLLLAQTGTGAAVPGHWRSLRVVAVAQGM